MDKPFKTTDELVSLLKGRGVEISPSTEMIIAREGYYPVVNGYKDIFLDVDASREAGDDRFKAGTAFDDIYRLFVFDRFLRLTFMRYLTQAEATLKTMCAYKFTEAHPNEVNPYLNIDYYAPDRRDGGFAASLIKGFCKAIGQDASDESWKRKPYLSHYIERHNGEVPLWVLMNYLTLGQAFKFFDCQTDSMKNSIAKGFSEIYNKSHEKPVRIHARQLRLAYDHIKDFRNICAHDERLYCARVASSRDISVARLFSDLGLVLSREDHTALAADVIGLIVEVARDLNPYGRAIISKMGIDSLEKTFITRE